MLSDLLETIDVLDPNIYADQSWIQVFERLRKDAPVHFTEQSRIGPFWSLTSYKDVQYAARTHVEFSAQVASQDAGSELDMKALLLMDPPHHSQLRMAFTPGFARPNLEKFKDLIRKRVIEILDGLPVGKTFNWVEAVSVELTLSMLAAFFDIPFEKRHRLGEWTDAIVSEPQRMDEGAMDPQERAKLMMECFDYFEQIWLERAARENPGSDIISLLSQHDHTMDMPSRKADFMGNIGMLVVGGNDTTRNSISAGIVGMHDNPGGFDKLRHNPELIPNACSEMIRWQTPILSMRRTAACNIEIGGRHIKKGDLVLLWYMSANRDEDVFENANSFMIDRPNASKHLAFSTGAHHCLGKGLAEMQLRILWEEILKRFRTIEVTGEVKRLANNQVHGILDVPVIVHPL